MSEKVVEVWDGSFLKEVKKKDIESVMTIDGHKGRLIKVKNTLPFILDELKPLLQLNKLGTRKITSGRHIYLLYKYHEEDVTLEAYSQDKKLNNFLFDQIRNIYAVRELMGLAKNSQRNIIIRQEKGKNVKAISIGENNCNIEQEKKQLSNKVMKECFTDKTLEQTVCQLLDYEHENNVKKIAFLQTLRDNVDKIIQRVDKEYVWFTSYLIERVEDCIKRL
jgi:hypothetical protein